MGAPKKLRFFGGGDPWESRTPVCGVRGRRLDHLTNGPIVASSLPAPNRAGKLTFPVTNLRLWESLLPKTNLRLFLLRDAVSCTLKTEQCNFSNKAACIISVKVKPSGY